MSDRPTAVNGKRSQAWGTTSACPACGECLCFGCHPNGPCVDEHAAAPAADASRARFGEPMAWSLSPSSSIGVSGLQLRSRQ
jgi:hypothetical protein